MSLLIYIGVVLLILGVVFLIPKWVIQSSRSESDSNHLYSIFWEESGYRAHKILSVIGSLFPFLLISNPSYELEGIVLIILIGVTCFFYHLTIYRGYNVFDRRLKKLLPIALLFLLLISFSVRYGYLPGAVMTISLVVVGGIWGSYAVYKRAKLIQHALKIQPRTKNAN
ncbi:hypothetical protein BTA51_04895 [Hahella sp. CCB-MM4]|nr:hypothetical protein BTA51_04895 [Hahella sp. CCB-MM4]